MVEATPILRHRTSSSYSLSSSSDEACSDSDVEADDAASRASGLYERTLGCCRHLSGAGEGGGEG